MGTAGVSYSEPFADGAYPKNKIKTHSTVGFICADKCNPHLLPVNHQTRKLKKKEKIIKIIIKI
jgi:hypothetical protein